MLSTIFFQTAVVGDVAVRLKSAAGDPDMTAPVTATTVGLGRVPERSPPRTVLLRIKIEASDRSEVAGADHVRAEWFPLLPDLRNWLGADTSAIRLYVRGRDGP
jgi:hypothetical protein